MSAIHQAPLPRCAVFDIGRVLFQWQLRALFEKLIADKEELDWFLAEVVTEEWHFQQDAGVPLSTMLPERMARYPDQALRIAAYAARFNETIPGPVEGVHELVAQLDEAGVPLFCLTNFGADLFPPFRATQPIFDRFRDIVVSGEEKLTKPDPRIYAVTEARCGFAGSDIFFTDDNAANVEAARAQGWHAHLFRDAAGLERALRDCGLLGGPASTQE